MFEERGVVAVIGDGECWVDVEESTACANCVQKCSVSDDQGTGSPSRRVRAACPEGLAVALGDRVLLAVSERALLGSTVLMYIGPLLALFCGAAVGMLIQGSWPLMSRDGAAGAGAVLGFVGYLLSIKLFGTLEVIASEPIVVRRLGQ
jgi:sigma-E factor negative regulatory protein RseC